MYQLPCLFNSTCTDGFCSVQEARQLFLKPDVLEDDVTAKLQWTAPDTDKLVDYLVNEKQFSEERVRSGIAKINAARGKGQQNRLESFFKARTCRLRCILLLSLPCIISLLQGTMCASRPRRGTSSPFVWSIMMRRQTVLKY